jgi:flagellin
MSTIGIQQLSGVVVSNRASSQITLSLSQRYATELQDYRSKLGATTSRIQTFINTLHSSVLNYQAASSQITDVDVADAVANQVAGTIRQQVASALLAQANQAPAISLKLLIGA